MANVFINAIDITPTIAGSWQDVDLSPYIPVGTTGVSLLVSETSLSSRSIGVRKKGSTDNILNLIYSGRQTSFFIGVDANRFCQVYVGATSLKVRLVGYFEADAVFFTNAQVLSLPGLYSWLELDVSTYVPVGAKALMFEFTNVSAGYFGFRNSGSTDDYRNWSGSRHQGILVGCNSITRICEVYPGHSAQTIRLVGYLTVGNFLTNSIDVSLASGASYQVKSTGLPISDYRMALIQVTGTSSYTSFRRNTSSADDYKLVSSQDFFLVLLDDTMSFSGYIGYTDVKFYLLGTDAPNIPPPSSPTNEELMRHLKWFHGGENKGCYLGSRIPPGT